ncbi:hypothetical protein [Phenylobacterium aquaticum]|uniref:hypothetical protein n=1 Tax=Phenylobacterium aquaticum TaxID=1763816 RepID=UPI0026F1776F|nr:hypothetical protein [Phenylobacterium aquaticum]
MRFQGLLLCLTLLLGGCNRVYSHQPLFHDATGLPAIRTGNWRAIDPDPTTDPSDGRILIRPGGRLLIIDEDGSRTQLRLFPGDPLILQTRASKARGGPGYFYYGVRIHARNALGQATRLSFWPVDCGPPPPTVPDGAPQQWVTAAPYPGLLPDGDNCLAWAPEAVRNAARASERQEEATDLVWKP